MVAPSPVPGTAHEPVRVGLVGAGPWAQVFYGPMLASSAHADLTAVWARRSDTAEALAAAHGTTAVASFDALLERVEAVAFAVPPDVQAELAVRAAAAGKHLLLEKPLAVTAAQAAEVAGAAEAAGVVSQMVLTWRYLPYVRSFLTSASGFDAAGARALSISGWALDGALFATPWRQQHGALLDVGPHVLDLLDVALGPIVRIESLGDPRRWVALTIEHETGALSQASLSITTPIEAEWSVELFGPSGTLALGPPEGADAATQAFAEGTKLVTTEFAACIGDGRAHPLDARRGLYLQRLIEQSAVRT